MLPNLVIAFLPRSKCLLISWLQSPCAVILECKKTESNTVPTFSSSICHEVMWMDAMILVLWMLSFKLAFSLSSFTFIKRLFSSSLLSAIRVVSSAYLRLLIFLPSTLIPACASSSLAFLMMYSAYKLNKQGDNKPSYILSPVSNQFVVPCPFVSVASWTAYRFLRRQVRWSDIPISKNFSQFVVIHPVKRFAIINKAEDVFLALSWFFNYPVNVGNLISGPSAFSKFRLNIWEFLVHVLMKPGLDSFEYCFANVSDECDCAIVWTFFGIAFLWAWNENWPFTVVATVEFSKFAGIFSAALSLHHLLWFELA